MVIQYDIVIFKDALSVQYTIIFIGKNFKECLNFRPRVEFDCLIGDKLKGTIVTEDDRDYQAIISDVEEWVRKLRDILVKINDYGYYKKHRDDYKSSMILCEILNSKNILDGSVKPFLYEYDPTVIFIGDYNFFRKYGSIKELKCSYIKCSESYRNTNGNFI